MVLIAGSYSQEGMGVGRGELGLCATPTSLPNKITLSQLEGIYLWRRNALHGVYPCLYTLLTGSSLPVGPLLSLGGLFWGKVLLWSRCTL